MSYSNLFKPLSMKRGEALKNRILLAPLTNHQSNPDGTASEDDYKWYEMISKGGYSLTMTCASHVQARGQAFPGQLGIFDDNHLEGLQKIAQTIKNNGSLSSVQIHHGGLRALTNDKIAPTEFLPANIRGLNTDEVEELIEDFVQGALRAEKAGFDGVEVHSAFGYIFAQFLSASTNKRTDKFGGNLNGRSKFLFDVIEEIRKRTNPEFQIGLRFSMDRYGIVLDEIVELAEEAMRVGHIDYLDLAPWDIDKLAEEGKFKGKRIIEAFTQLPRYGTLIGASGKIVSADKAIHTLELGCDFIMVGKAAILDFNFPLEIQKNIDYNSPRTPVSEEFMTNKGLSKAYINYLKQWEGFVR